MALITGNKNQQTEDEFNIASFSVLVFQLISQSDE